MRKINNYVLTIAGSIATIVGIIFLIPSLLRGDSIISILATILMVAGIIIIAYGLGEDAR